MVDYLDDEGAWICPVCFNRYYDKNHALKCCSIMNIDQSGIKHDDGKISASLLDGFNLALLAMAAVGTYGEKKYSRNNHKEVPNRRIRYHDAFWRHMLKAPSEKLDSESKLPHEWHALWNLADRVRRDITNNPEYQKLLDINVEDDYSE